MYYQIVPYYLLTKSIRTAAPHTSTPTTSHPHHLYYTTHYSTPTPTPLPLYSPDMHHPIDYRYIRIQHISTINHLCEEFFWKGIDSL